MAHINKCIVDLLAKSKCSVFIKCSCCECFFLANKKPAQEHAAVWVPDSDASTCMHCLKTKFTPINRRVCCVVLLFPNDKLLVVASLPEMRSCCVW